MDSKNGLIPFGLLVFLFAFSFMFGLDSLRLSNMVYLGFAIAGFGFCIFSSLLLGLFSRRDGEAIAIWYNIYLFVVAIIFVWYLTRVGVFFKLW